MPAKKFLRNIAGFANEVTAVQTSAGATNGGDIPALNDQGVFDTSLMPPGIAADTSVVQASEALTAGNYVNIFDGGAGVFRARKADASTTGKHAHGFVLVGVASGANATVFFEGSNNAVTGQTPGDVYLSATTAGATTATPPSTAGQIVQPLGVAVSATVVNTEIDRPIVLA